MESESKNCVVWWCDLLPELVAKIAGQIPTDIIRFRSVCRSWRLSLPPPPFPDKHIHFPLAISFDGSKPTPVTPNAVYLFRHHRDDSKVWMLSAQESNPGNFLLRHPLTYKPIPGSSGNNLDLSECRRVTQIHTNYIYRDDAPEWCPWWQRKVVLVPNSTTPTAICRYHQPRRSLWSFRTTTEDEEGSNISYATQLYPFVHREFVDFVSFDGWIYLVEALDIDEYGGDAHSYDILMFDYKTSQQFGIVCDNLRQDLVRASRVCFVVSDGDLYVVVGSRTVDDPYNYECRVYRLVRDDMNVPTSCKWERVEDLGDRVFFISKNDSFSVSAPEIKGLSGEVFRDLPLPCVVLSCLANEEYVSVYDLGTEQRKYWLQTLSKGYSDLCSPPSSGLIKAANK